MIIVALGLIVVLYYLFQQKITKLQNQIDYLNTRINHLREEVDKKSDSKIEEIPTKIQLEKSDFPQPSVKPTEELPVKSLGDEPRSLEPQRQSNTDMKSEEKKYYPPAPTFIDRTIEFLKENFLTVIGVITLVLGIGYFVKYAIDQNWINETLRVIIGIAVGFAIIGTGHYLQKKYTVFSSILVGGGVSVLYFTITIAFREYHLFSQSLSFILLAFVTLLSIILSFIYHQQTLFVFSLLGGFAAPLMISTGESNYIFLFTYLGILNLGTLFIAWKKDWITIRFIAFGLSALFFLPWVGAPTTKIIFFFIGLYYLLFTVFAILPYLKGKTMDTIHVVLYALQNLYFVGIGILSYTHYYAEFTSLIPIIAVLLNFAILGISYRKDHLLNDISLSLIIAFVTLAIGVEFEVNMITALWAIQSSLLLYLWKRLQNPIFKIGFIALIPIFMISLGINWAKYIFDDQNYGLILNPIFATSCFVFICSLINIYLIKDFKETENVFGFKIYYAQNVFSIVSILFIYFGLLFEIIYQTEKHYELNIIAGIGFLYSIYFVSIILLFSRAFNINTYTKYILGIVNFGLMFCFPLILWISDELLIQSKPFYYYTIYVIYLIPFAFFSYKFFHQKEFNELKRNQFSQWFVFIVTAFIISFEMYNAYMIAFTPTNAIEIYIHNQELFRMILLPIVWAVMGFGLIYFGFKKHEKNLPMMGFSLFVLIIGKLYLYDVWEMSNGFRVVSFIVLGILILITSFMYQKLKHVVAQLFDPKEK